jgi:hypothetical protein
MAYAIITGAHLFPYAWFYDEIGYAVCAVLISLGSLLIALNAKSESIWMVPMFTAVVLLVLAGWIYQRTKSREQRIKGSIIN